MQKTHKKKSTEALFEASSKIQVGTFNPTWIL